MFISSANAWTWTTRPRTGARRCRRVMDGQPCAERRVVDRQEPGFERGGHRAGGAGGAGRGGQTTPAGAGRARQQRVPMPAAGIAGFSR
ncbi:MAG: hypothetical protein MZW92_21450 [Comamonadaceae bacterium]|nr:hypothetical protein [Comamonadaceae bacterium]